MATIFLSFDAKNLSNGQKFIWYKKGKPIFSKLEACNKGNFEHENCACFFTTINKEQVNLAFFFDVSTNRPKSPSLKKKLVLYENKNFACNELFLDQVLIAAVYC